MQFAHCHTIAARAAIAFLIVICSAGTALAQDQVLATVNGQPIMSGQLQTELLHRWGDIALATLIQELAIEQAAAEAGVTATDQEVEQRVETFQRNLDANAPVTGESFSLWLARQKLTPYAFRKWLRAEVLLEKMVADQAAVSEEDVRQVFEASRERLRQPERLRVSHICVKTQEEAAQIRAAIIAGKPFEEAARESSIDPYTKDAGGAFGLITRGENPFQQAAFALGADNELSEPVQTQMGWHIIRRDEYLPATTPEFEDVKDEIRERLERQRLLALMNRKRAEILQAARVEHELDPDQLVTQ
ncbi:MAG: peptidyl-prolyl cis-trans isomerase [Armatimonadota bacterium]